MKHRSLTSDPPVRTDPVVVAGITYRILVIDKGLVEARETFGERREVSVPLDDLYWDPLAGVWRA